MRNSLRDLGTFSPFGKLDPSRFKPDYGKYTTLRLIGIGHDGQRSPVPATVRLSPKSRGTKKRTVPDCRIRATGIVFFVKS